MTSSGIRSYSGMEIRKEPGATMRTNQRIANHEIDQRRPLDAKTGLLWVVILALLMSAVSLYYYLQVLKQAFVAPVPNGASTLRPAWTTSAMLTLLALAVVILGCAPNWLVTTLLAAIPMAGP